MNKELRKKLTRLILGRDDEDEVDIIRINVPIPKCIKNFPKIDEKKKIDIREDKDDE